MFKHIVSNSNCMNPYSVKECISGIAPSRGSSPWPSFAINCCTNNSTNCQDIILFITATTIYTRFLLETMVYKYESYVGCKLKRTLSAATITQKSDDDASTSAALSSKTARSCGPAIQEDPISRNLHHGPLCPMPDRLF